MFNYTKILIVVFFISLLAGCEAFKPKPKPDINAMTEREYELYKLQLQQEQAKNQELVTNLAVANMLFQNQNNLPPRNPVNTSCYQTGTIVNCNSW